MPETTTVTTEKQIQVVAPMVIGEAPPPPFASWCEWAKNGYYNALAALSAVGTGVKAYHIGSRGVEYLSAGNVWSIVDQWRKLYEYYCGADALPPGITGRDTACRIVPRDV
jgi:hypothetical protein